MCDIVASLPQSGRKQLRQGREDCARVVEGGSAGGVGNYPVFGPSAFHSRPRRGGERGGRVHPPTARCDPR